MKFEKAVEKKTGLVFTLNQLELMTKGDERLKDLQCPNCGCKLIFHHSGTKKAYLSTKGNEDHSEDCELKVLAEQAASQTKYKGQADVLLTSSMQKSRSYTAFQDFKKLQDLEAGVAIKVAPPKSGTKSPRKGPITEKDELIKLIPKASGESTIDTELTKGRRVSTPTRHPNNLVQDDVNQTFKFSGWLDDITVQSNRIWFDVSFMDVQKRLIVNEAAFNKAPVNYDKLMETIKLKSSIEKVIFTCVIETIPSSTDGSLQCMIRDVTSILINGMQPAVYLAKLK